MKHLAKIELVGRVGAVNEHIVANERLVRFSVGVDTVYSGMGGSSVSTTWFGCSYWGNCEVKRGQEIHLEGWMVGQHYVDQEGRDRQVYEVKVQRIW